MTTIKIPSLDKEIELKPYTRAISRRVEEVTMENVVIRSVDGLTQTTEMPAVNGSKAEEEAIKLISWLSSEEMDMILDEEYAILKKAVQEHTTKGQKKTK